MVIDGILVQCAERGLRKVHIFENIYTRTLVSPFSILRSYRSKDNDSISNYGLYIHGHKFSLGERPHYCSLCNKGFQTSSDLKRHKRTRVHQERVEQAGGIDPIDTAPPASAAATTAATAAAAVANTGAGTPGGFTTDDDSSLSGVQLVHNTSNNSSVGGGPNDAGSTAQALLNSITEPVPVVPSGQVVVGSSMIGTRVSRKILNQTPCLLPPTCKTMQMII